VLTESETIVRIGLCALLGGAIGFERELSEHHAGFRTHVLVALGAGLFTLAGVHAMEAYADQGARVDPTRIAAQVVTGIGFLGAGTILRQGATVRGLTTAASLWVTAAIGTAVGLGFLSGGIATTIAALIALVVLRWIESHVFRRADGDEGDPDRL
jgi:putative Mg2+ transporter-C (MgtC) family protein